MRLKATKRISSLATWLTLMSDWISLFAAPAQILHVRQPQRPETLQLMRMQHLPETASDRPVDVKECEKLELRIDLKATFQNPYDPDKTDLWAGFKAPSGKAWRIW